MLENFYNACRNGKLKKVKELVGGVDDVDIYLGICLCTINDNVKIAKFLYYKKRVIDLYCLIEMVDSNAVKMIKFFSKRNRLSIDVTASALKHIDSVNKHKFARMLLTKIHYDLDTTNEILHRVCRMGNESYVEMALVYGGAKNVDLVKLFNSAASSGNIEIVKLITKACYYPTALLVELLGEKLSAESAEFKPYIFPE